MTKFLLMAVNDPAYTFYVTETTVTRGESRNPKADKPPRTRLFFRPHAFARLQWSGLGGGSLRARRFPLGRSLNFHHVPGLPFESGSQASTTKGGRNMRQALARPEQTQSPDSLTLARNGERYPLTIIRAALREAATAPTVFDALDLTGDALRRLADLAKAEGDHA